MNSQPSGEASQPGRHNKASSQEPADPTNLGWSDFADLDRGYPQAGTLTPPFDSQLLEHWHAWETQPDCGPTH
eukprot:1006809-Heterocapsa_arctica.AAC.1